MEIDLNNFHFWAHIFSLWISLNKQRVTWGFELRVVSRRSGGGRHHGGLGVSQAGVAGGPAAARGIPRRIAWGTD